MSGTRSIVLGAIAAACSTQAASAQFVFTDVDYPTLPQPKGLVVGDFNGDSLIDIAVTASDQVGVFLNAGDGAMVAGATIPFSGTGAGHLMGARLDADAKLDLAAVLSDTNQVQVMRGVGDGTFTPGALVAVGEFPTWVIGFDADGDKDVDMAVVNSQGPSLTVLFNDGNGEFPESATIVVGADPRSVAAADLDGDGDRDLVVTQHTDRTVATFLNDGHGVFTFNQAIGMDGELAPESIVAADLNDDGTPEVVATASVAGGPGRAVVYRNTDGTLVRWAHYAMGAGDPGAVITADFNGDGIPDLGAVGRASDEFSLLQGHGDGTFAKGQTLRAGDNPRRIRAADFNGDGAMDAVLTNRDSSDITVYLNAGTQGGCLADLDGNGVLELFDFLEFQNLFNASDPKADCEKNGTFDLFDFLCFQNLFLQGCNK